MAENLKETIVKTKEKETCRNAVVTPILDQIEFPFLSMQQICRETGKLNFLMSIVCNI